jgi:protein RecA
MARRPLIAPVTSTAPIGRRPLRTPAPVTNGVVHAPYVDLDHADPRFFPTGSMMLDCVLAGSHGPGGWGTGRIINVVGDKSTGKTLLAVEACANFTQFVAPEHVRYVECESAFDEEYGEVIGMPAAIKPVDTIRTAEEFLTDLDNFCREQMRYKTPCLYVLDSLDALSDDAELKRKLGDGTYGMGKAKMLSEGFRRIVSTIAAAKCTVIIISQIRDKINVSFGETKTRAGGKALDFYASQVVWLAEIGKIKRQALGVERVTGLNVRIRNRKNKLGPAHREAEQVMLFGYGIDDEESMLKWLVSTKVLGKADAWRAEVEAARIANDRTRMKELNYELRKLVWQRWSQVEEKLAPVGRKYS